MTKQTEISRKYWHDVFSDGGEHGTIPRWTLNPSSQVFDYEEKIPIDVIAGLQSLAKESSLSLETLLLTSHAKVLAALSGEANVTTGYMIASGAGALPCRLSVESASWREMARVAHERLSDFLLHSEFPIEELAQEVNVSEQAFETIFCPSDKLGPLIENAVLSISFTHDGADLTLQHAISW